MRVPLAARVSLVVSALLLAACSLSPLRWLTASRATAEPVISLARCDEREDVLCLVTFGLEPPDQMLIVLHASPDLPEALEVVVKYKDELLKYPCERPVPSLTVAYCAGPQLPLGSSIRIEVYAADDPTLLAAGDFVLIALALPTVPGGGTPNPTASAQSFVTPTNTFGPVRLSPTPSPRGTVSATRTPTPGPAYPNPNQ